MSTLTPLLQTMLATCDARGLLTHYRDDLAVRDAETLADLGGWDRFVWLVGCTYSYVFPIGLHPQQHKEALEVAQARGKGFSSTPMACFIVTPAAAKPLREVTQQLLRDVLAASPCWTLSGRAVTDSRGMSMGTVDIEYIYEPRRGSWTAETRTQPRLPACKNALEYFAVSQAVATKGMWTTVFRADEVDASADQKVAA